MLEIRNIHKEYKTGTLVQKALDGVSLSFRENEFVAILGPSGSGKTTLLNIIGGLDCLDSGELIIDGIPTQKYKSRDWDAYRNHSVGFIFQSYNLIPHQSLRSNVELAMTLAGDRTVRAQGAGRGRAGPCRTEGADAQEAGTAVRRADAEGRDRKGACEPAHDRPCG